MTSLEKHAPLNKRSDTSERESRHISLVPPVCSQPDTTGLIQQFSPANSSSGSMAWGRGTSPNRLWLRTRTISVIVVCPQQNVKSKAEQGLKAGGGDPDQPNLNNGVTVLTENKISDMNWSIIFIKVQYLQWIFSPSTSPLGHIFYDLHQITEQSSLKIKVIEQEPRSFSLKWRSSPLNAALNYWWCLKYPYQEVFILS